jgi:hypothetical protein
MVFPLLAKVGDGGLRLDRLGPARRQRLKLARLQRDLPLLWISMVRQLQLQDAGAPRVARLVEVDAQAALGIGRDVVGDVGEGDLGVLRGQALDGDLQRLDEALGWAPRGEYPARI